MTHIRKRSSSDPSVNIKAEPVDLLIPKFDPEENTPTKRRKVIFEVVVPTLAEVNSNRKDVRRGRELVTIKSDIKTKLAGSKVKKSSGELPGFDLDTVNRRLDVLGAERNFEVNLPDAIKFTAVPRIFLSQTWGGNTQSTYPTIAKEKLMKHSLNDWLYPNSLYNPNCPQVGGCAGLMYSPNGLDEFEDDSDEVFRTIVRHRTESLWEYMGQYIQIRAPSLTQVEWLQQDVKVRNTWAKEIWKKGWGWVVRARVTVRKNLEREATRQEIEDALADVDNKYQTITPDDIRVAYDLGEERLGVYVMKCVGYDEAFQREVHAKFQTWVKPPVQTKRRTKKKKGSDGRVAKKVLEEVYSDEDEDVNVDSELLGDEDHAGEDEEDDVEMHINYLPRGTKSRPRQVT